LPEIFEELNSELLDTWDKVELERNQLISEIPNAVDQRQ